MAARASKQGISLVKRAWNEIPVVVICLGSCALGFALHSINAVNYFNDLEKAHQHKFSYTVVRTSDVDPNNKYLN